MFEALQAAYAWIESFGLSISMLVTVTCALFVACAFAARESLTWFLKVEDIKKDLDRLNDSVGQLEGEIRIMSQRLLEPRVIPEPPAPSFTPEVGLGPSRLNTRQSRKSVFPVQH